MNKLSKWMFLGACFLPNMLLALPETPTGLCINKQKCSNTDHADFFPGTQLRFYPGYVLNSSSDEAPADIEARWQKLFGGYTSSNELRKEAYRPDGIYAGVTRRLDWKHFYKNGKIRPNNPLDHEDPAYDWTKLDAVFEINAVKKEGALVALAVGEVGYSGYPDAPAWLGNDKYNGIFISGIDGGSKKLRYTPKYYRYSGPDILNRTNMNANEGPPIVAESLYFYQAMHDHLVAKGYIDKVMFVKMSEYFVKKKAKNPYLPDNFNRDVFDHGVGYRSKEIAKIWAQSGIPVHMSSLTGSARDTLWQYMENPNLGITFPDMKLEKTNADYSYRFKNPGNVYQKNLRQLSHATEKNGQRSHTYFAPDIPNPWGYSGVSVPQTASHILWAVSGKPCDGSDDPEGLMPVHNIIIDFERSWHKYSPTTEEWHEAIERFGPTGTGAFPYLPQAYRDQWPNLKCGQ